MQRPLLVRSFCKVNLALEILGRRPDGYHELRTVFQTIDLHDDLTIADSSELTFECPDMPDLHPEENLVWRAATALRDALGLGLGGRIVLRKRVPAGSGLGGGSSNAAAALAGLCRHWNVDPPAALLARVGARLGSDVPFFLEGGTALGIGRGEEIHPLPDLPETPLVVVYPGVSVSTEEAYRSLNLTLTSWKSPNNISGFCRRLRDGQSVSLFNDFESSVFPAHPEIAEAKRFLESRGATAALLSGSGSSVFGFFPSEESALAAVRNVGRTGWWVLPAKTLSRVEYSLRMFG